jgi:hypothetical protein
MRNRGYRVPFYYVHFENEFFEQQSERTLVPSLDQTSVFRAAVTGYVRSISGLVASISSSRQNVR